MPLDHSNVQSSDLFRPALARRNVNIIPSRHDSGSSGRTLSALSQVWARDFAFRASDFPAAQPLGSFLLANIHKM